jgi:PPP family 3-phenylpropionic acid transporter
MLQGNEVKTAASGKLPYFAREFGKGEPMRTNTSSSIIYFLYFAAIAAVVPFLALYYRSMGLSGSQVGLLLGISPMVTLFGSPFWTGLADARQRHRVVLTITLVAAVAIMSTVPAITNFGLLLFAIILFSFFSAPIMSLVDSATLSSLGDQREKYGRIRLWGTIGWGLSAVLVGMIFQRFGLRWMFWSYAILTALILIPNTRLKFPSTASETPFWTGVRSLLANRHWVLFLLMIFVAAIGMAAHTNYLSILMDKIGGSETLIGVAFLISTVFELPVMFFSNLLLRKLSTRGVLILAIGLTGLRCVLYAFARSPWVVIAIQGLHGFTFPALWIAAATYASENAPEGLSATAQGLLGSFLLGFGASTGGLLGGVLLDRFGVEGMFGIVGFLVIFGLISILTVERFMKISPTT